MKLKILLMLLAPTIVFANFNFIKDLSLEPTEVGALSENISKEIFRNKGWPEIFSVDEKKFKIEYTFNDKLTKYVKQQLKRYRSDYTAVVVIDNNTGEILTAIDYTRKTRTFGKDLTFSNTNPAASIFKVITAADLLENTNVNPNTMYSYNGKGSTLYKYQLKERKNRWTRRIPLKKAFAYSNNVIFGKAAIKDSTHGRLRQTASKFGFNKNLVQLIDSGNSSLFMQEDSYSLAEFACGFNRETLISPVHGAVIASVMANNGVMRKPTLVKSIYDEHLEKEIWHPSYETSRVLSETAVSQMREMMELTVKRGTARGAFRAWKTKKIKNITIGGKTGSITGGLPYGKRDWFVSYAQPKNSDDKGISMSVMTVNVTHWYIKSADFAKRVIQHYYTKVKK